MQSPSSFHPVIIYDSTPLSSLPGEQSPENIKRAKLEWDRRNSLEREWLGPAKLQRGEGMRMCAEDADQIHMEMARLEQVEKECIQALQPSLRERGLESKQKLYISHSREHQEKRDKSTCELSGTFSEMMIIIQHKINIIKQNLVTQLKLLEETPREYNNKASLLGDAA